MSREREVQQGPAATTSSSDSDWLDDSLAFLAADLGHGFEEYGWLLPPSTAQEQHDAGSMTAETLPHQSVEPRPGPGLDAGCAASAAAAQELGRTKKRKSPEHTGPPEQRRQSSRKPGKKGTSATAGTERDARWAEQLLNPCAAAVEAGNLPRAQHLLFVLGELASSSGEPNHRLAAHGLRALAPRLPAASVNTPPASMERSTPAAFRHVDPRLFRAALIRFHEASPWFALPNALANATIVATRGAIPEPRCRRIHVVDVGVSHGVQWPTLLDALATARGAPRGASAPTPPPSVRLTVVTSPTATGPSATFSTSPPGYDSAPQLLRYASSVGLDLAIDHAACLDTLLQGVTITAPDEVRVVCVQFRLSYLTAEEQAAVLEKVRNLNPELVVLAELDHAGRSNDGSMASEFAARLEMLWNFLESTAAAFKGRDADERRVMEAEAGTALTMPTAAIEGWETWRARMIAAGLVEVAFGGEAVETARALMRRYDSGWELVPPSLATGAAVGLRWKGQPVSFCSLWRPA
ncbi:hypothetical protein QOZ80_7AG0576830 [Eleusine coracana subsp. coracana]|nr:hypothetical protein QOZ80_7AG0576830 [Eleusine coracana subsp. coracana]